MVIATQPVPSSIDRALGVAGIIGGAAILVAFLPIDLPWSPVLFDLRLLLFNAGAIAVVLGVHRRQARLAPALAMAGAIPAVVANAWYLVLIAGAVSRPGEIGPGDDGRVIDVSAATMWLADAWFGVVAFRIGAVQRWSALALAVGSIVALGGMSRLGLVDGPFGAILGPIALIGIALHGLGWILLGIDVALRPRGGVSRPAAAKPQPNA